MKFHSLKDIENKVPKPGSFKHFLRIQEHGGRVVKGVNTTADVGVDAIKKQAAKFGNKVDKDGRPPTLSKKVKGSKTNVLFNLGMTESIDWNTLWKAGAVMPYLYKSKQNPNPDPTTPNIITKWNLEKEKFDPATETLTPLKNVPNWQQYMDGWWASERNKPEAKTKVDQIRWSAKQVGIPIKEKTLDNTDESMLYYAKMAENLGELASTSKVYVDMDGVLADFFGEWQKLIGKDWRKVKDIEPALQKIRDKDNFWLDLPLLPQAKNLLGVIKKVKGSYTILSSPLPNDPNSEPHKREWIKKNLDFFPPENVIITHDKPKYAVNSDGTPNILIDDFGKNIASWEAAGGEGFKHKDHKFERTAKAIKQHMQEPVKEKAVSKKQQQFFGIVRAMQKGDMPKGGEAGEVAKDMKKSDVKKFASTKHKGLPKKKKSESYTRDQLPQIRKKHLEYIPHKIVSIKVESIIPIQKERLKENYTKQLKKIAKGDYTPIVVDSTNRIVNGHHRYDVVKMLQMESITVAKLPYTLEFVLGMMTENFADGKKKGKSRPGRVKKAGASCNGSVTSLRKRAKNASGEKAKMYHWCANMKSGRKKSESYTREQFYNILIESSPQQLEEGIKDQLAKLPKNLLGKITPILKKIPKTAKNLVLVATLLGTIVGAVQAGDMAKVDTPLDKLNNMTTMSATMDPGNDIGPGHAMPDNIKVLKMPTPPPAPGADTPDGTNDNGVSTQTDKNGNRTVSSGAGTYTFSSSGDLLKYETPKMGGLQQTHDIAKKTVTVDFGTTIKGAGIDQKATYDMSGKLISADNTSISSGDMGVSIDKDKGKTVDITTLSGTKHSLNDKDPKKYDKLAAMKKDMDQSQADFKKANTATLKKMGISR